MQNTSENTPDELLNDYPECLIINDPDLKSMPVVFGEGILTIIFWGLWFYLWLPLISALAWLFGFHMLYSYIVELGGLEGFLKQLDVFCSGIVVSSAVLILWSFYNLKRYGAYNRRTIALQTNDEALMKRFSLTKDQLIHMRKAKRVTVFFVPQKSAQTEESICV